MIRYFIPILFFFTGIISLLAAVLNWDWFFKSKNAQMFISHKNRKKARWFYGILGIMLVGMAIVSFLTVNQQ